MFSWENLDNARAAFDKLIARIAALDPQDGSVDEAVLAEYKEKFLQQMGNDLNTSMGVTALFDVLKAKTNDATKLALIGDFDSVLSLGLLEKAAAKRAEAAQAKTTQTESGYTVTGEGAPEIDALVKARGEAKKAKDFPEADRIRDELKARGLNDSITHVDFMVGTPDLNILGITHDGKEIPVFVDGNFAPEI